MLLLLWGRSSFRNRLEDLADFRVGGGEVVEEVVKVGSFKEVTDKSFVALQRDAEFLVFVTEGLAFDCLAVDLGFELGDVFYLC